MEFRLVQHAVNGPSSGIDLVSPRRIRFASDIPLVGLRGFEREPRPVRLRGVVDDDTASYVRVHGAYQQGPFWYVDRRDPFPFDLGEHLPRMAHHMLVPEIPETGRASDWRASLQAMMWAPAWGRLVADIWRRERVCHECGSVPFRPARLEGRECWVEEHGVRRLVSIRLLCTLCMEAVCPEAATRAGNSERAFRRLCALNRIDPRVRGETAAYRRTIWETPHQPWPDVVEIDLSEFSGIVLPLRESIYLSDDGFLVQSGVSGAVRVLSAEIEREGRGLALRPFR